MERLVLLLPEGAAEGERMPPVFVAALGEESRRIALRYVTELRREGMPAALDYDGRSLKSQMRRADRMGARYVLIFGDKELKVGRVLLRDMSTKEQEEVSARRAVERVTYLNKKAAE
jgi:histidyl-tRNA synthetase